MKNRLYFIDYIRVFAFLLLILFHSALPFVNYNWEVKNEQKSEILLSIVLWFHQWRLPLLFFISGVGIYFSLKTKNILKFTVERFRRLFIPLVFAMLFTIPVQVYVEYLQKGRLTGNYFEFYPSVWDFVPYPDGSLTWSHMWFIVYLLTFILTLIPLFSIMKIKMIEKYKDRFSNELSSKYLIFLVFFIQYYNYYQFYLKYPEQGSLVEDWFVFNSSITYLILGYLLASSNQFWNNCERYRKISLSFAVMTSTILFINYYLPNVLPKKEGLDAQVYFLLDALQIWSIIMTIIGFAKKYLNTSSSILQYLNQAVFPFFIIHQTIIVALGYWIVQLKVSILSKYMLLSVCSSIIIYLLYEYVIRRTKLTRFLYGMKSQ
jgi:surface polysaccharide O-acyltransferase-like enzyme